MLAASVPYTKEVTIGPIEWWSHPWTAESPYTLVRFLATPEATLAETQCMHADPARSTRTATIRRPATYLGMDIHNHLDTSAGRPPSGIRE